MSSKNSQSNRNLIAICLLLVVAVVGFLLLRPKSDGQPKGTKEQYVLALGPVVDNAKKISGRLGSTPPGPELFDAVSKLESEWSETRTGPGYDRQTHDDFIIVFGSYVTRLKSAGMIWERLDSGSVRSEGEKTELLFMLQSLHGAETAAQLAGNRGLSVEVLLSDTNLIYEVTNSLAQAPAVFQNAEKLYRELVSENSEQ